MYDDKVQHKANLNEVPVVQRGLLNILARYPGEFDVLRELIQNADDANAPVVEVHFETEESQLTVGPDDLSKLKVRKWIIRNKGSFQQKDWERLGKIAAGNDDSTKVGAFGVGFYSVLSKSHQPVVKSDGKSLQFRWNDDGNLCTESACCAKDEWTSIELELKIEESLPDLVNLARFLVSSVASLTNIDTISVLLDGRQLLHIRKEASESTVDVPVPEHLMRATRSQVLTVESIQRTVQRIKADAEERIFAAGLTSLSTPADPEDILSKLSGCSDQAIPALGTGAGTMLQEEAITHDLYTATIRVDLNADPKMKNEVQSNMKSLPSCFKCKAIYFNSEQYDALQHLSKSQLPKANHLVRPFFGPHGIFPENCGRLFIGQSTNETTGIGLHISAHFLPTMERSAIDLANGQVAEWNKEVLWISGLLARIIYEAEMRKAADSRSGIATKLGLHTMARFAFGSFVPHSGVSQHLQDAFFSCCNRAKIFPLVSDNGISCASDSLLRRCKNDLSFLQTFRVPHPKLEPSQRDEIIKRCYIQPFGYSDIVKEFETGVTQDTMNSFFDWWEGAKRDHRQTEVVKRRFCKRIADTGVLRLSDGRRISLKDMRHFTFFPLPDNLCPMENLCIDVRSAQFTRSTVECFGWTQLPLLRWLEYACSQVRQLTPKDSALGHRISRILVQFALVEELFGRQWYQAADLVKDIKCIPTNKGLMSPGESYFDAIDICRDLPVADEDDFRDIPSTPVADAGGFRYKQVYPELVRTVFVGLGVRCEIEWRDLVERLETCASEESNVRLLQYLFLCGQLTFYQINDLVRRRVFRSQNGGPLPAAELYFPDESIRKLGLPVLALSPPSVNLLVHSGIPRESLEQLFESLRIQRYPSLKKIIELAASSEQGLRQTALDYLLSNLDTRYDGYRSDSFASIAFIPTKGGSLACPNEVLASSVWEKLGFKQASLRSRDLLKLGIKDDPSIDTIIKRLETAEQTLPSPDTARLWFGHLFQYGNFSPLTLRERFSNIPFVPLRTSEALSSQPSAMKYLTPKECFTSSDVKERYRYRNIFSFVDFGPNGNSFLESCCAKRSPDATDIVRKIVQDPQGYFEALGKNTELYREDLHKIASQFDSISDRDKREMKESPMFLAFQKDMNGTRLLLAHQVVISDWERPGFSHYVFLAPEDDVIEKLYREMGSQYLGTYVQCDVVPSGPNDEDELPFDRDRVVQRVQCFMSQRGKIEKANDSFYKEGSMPDFEVKVCKTLTMKKTFTPRDGILADGVNAGKIKPKDFLVKAGFKLDESTLWVVEGSSNSADLYKDVAVALCHVLLKNFEPNDILLLASLIEMDDDRLKGYYENEEEKSEQSIEPPAKAEPRMKRKIKIPVPRLIAKLLGLSARVPQAVSQKVISLEYDMRNAIESLCRIDEGTPPPDFSTRCQRHSTNFKQHNTRCKEAHKIVLDTKRNVQDESTQMKFFFAQNSQRQWPPEAALREFAKLISDLARIFDEGVSKACYIFWKDTDEDLMAFNRDQKYIFFNLAHYHKVFYPKDGKGVDNEKKVIMEWFLIMAHEIAHNITLEHDEYHGSLSSRLAIEYLPALRNSASFGCLAEDAQ